MTAEVILTLGLLLAAGLLARLVATLLRVPEMLILVAVGAAIGPSLGNLVDVPLDSLGAQLTFTLGVSAILFYGGLNLSLKVLRSVATSLALLSVVGILLTAAVVAVPAHYALEMGWTEALLLGAVLSPTDPAILVGLFSGSGLRPKVGHTLIAESGFNDPVGAVLALALAGAVVSSSGAGVGPSLAADFVVAMLISVGIGLVAGILLAATISSHRAGIWSESSAIAMAMVVTIGYFSLDSTDGSGYLGAFVAGIIVGNMRLLKLSMHSVHERELKDFARHVAEIVTLLVFLILGINLPFSAIAEYWLPALATILVLMLIARPLVVIVCALPDRRARWQRSELTFMSWSRETGVVPAALVGVLAGLGVPDIEIYGAVVALAIIVTLAIQAMPAPWLARRLGLLDSPQSGETEAAN